MDARVQTLIDRQDILDCLTRFSRGIDRFDRALFLSAFHADAGIAAGPFVGGPVALCDWSFALHEAGQEATQHNLLNHTCKIEGDVAHAETYYMFVARNRDGSVWLAGGRYVDRLEKRGGDWKIALRTNMIEWSCLPTAVPIPFTDVPGIDDNGRAERSPGDISYRRPLTNQRTPMVP
jgi:SnoaL-like domain